MLKRANTQSFNIHGHHTADFTSLQNQLFVSLRAADPKALVTCYIFITFGFQIFAGYIKMYRSSRL